MYVRTHEALGRVPTPYLYDSSISRNANSAPEASPGHGPLPYREAIEQMERRAFEDYSRACAGVNVLQWLRRPPLSLAEEIAFWERVIIWLPRLFNLKREAERRAREGRMTMDEARAIVRLQMNRVFPPGYALGSLADELARARCALSKVRWQHAARQNRGRTPLERRLHGPPAGLGWFGQPSSIACKPEPGEIAASRTAAGILNKDVEITDKGVFVTDFGVDRGSVKPGAKAELAATLERLENDPTVKSIRITGFDDCLKASPKDHRILRKRRALKVKELLGPKARAKLTFVGGAPLATFIGPNTDRAARARNRSVLIEFVSEVSFADEPQAITAQPCHEQLIRRALRQMRDDQSMDGKIKSRLGAALGNSLAGHDDSFIRPGSTSWMFPFHWSSIKQYFKLICDEPGGAAALSAAGLMRKLLELDQDIRNGVESLVREEQKFSSISNKKMVLATDFRRRLDALLKNKVNSTYAEY